MDRKFNIGDQVEILDYVDSNKTIGQGVITNCWKAYSFGQYAYNVRTLDGELGVFLGEYLRIKQ